MTTAADDRAVEEAFEASLAGRPVREGAAGLVAFTSAVRGAATQPGRPNAALADLLSTGLLTDQSSPSTRTAPAAGSLPSRRTRSRTRRRFTVIVPALIAKFLSAGALAQAATGAGVVVVVAAGAGVTGALPDGAQTAFSGLTGIQRTADERVEGQPDPSEGDAMLADTGEQAKAEEDGEAGTGAFEADAWMTAEVPGSEYPTFGAWVSDGARHRADLEALAAFGAEYRNFGEVVSERARAKGYDDAELADELGDVGIDPEDVGIEPEEVLEDGTGADQESGTDGEDSAADTSNPGRSGDKAKGAGNGAGKGAGNGAGKGAGKGRSGN